MPFLKFRAVRANERPRAAANGVPGVPCSPFLAPLRVCYRPRAAPNDAVKMAAVIPSKANDNVEQVTPLLAESVAIAMLEKIGAAVKSRVISSG